MIYSHYSEYMAKSMSSLRPSPDEGEFEYLKKYLDTNEEPFLELGCGYGRLLIPILEAGYSIIGTDSSPEMLEHCKNIATRRNVEPILYKQFMQKLSLDEQFGLIFIDDCTFTLIIEDKDVEELFERVYNHLKPGGTFLFDFFGYNPDYKGTINYSAFSGTNEGWIKDEDGTIYLSKAISSYSAENHLIKRLIVHDCYIDGKLVGSQAFEDPNKEHNFRKVIKALESKGFVDIRVGGHQTEDAPQENTNIYSIRCKK